MKLKFLISSLFIFSSLFAGAQTSYSLQQCVDYAIANNIAIKNRMLDTEIAESNKHELYAKGLPQVDASSQFTHNVNVQKIVLENGVISAFNNPDLAPGEVIAFQLQLNNAWTSQITASQILFDKSFFSGLNDAELYKSLALKNVQRTQVEVAEMVTKAYYGVLVSQKQLEFLGNNIQRVDSLFSETQGRFRNGLVRQISVDRIEVRLNNLKEERERANRLVELNMALLRFQMNVPNDERFILSESLNENVLPGATVNQEDSDPEHRIEYDILKTQVLLSEAETKFVKGGYYPKLTAIATSGYNPAASHVGDIFQGSRYFNYTYVGLDLRIPIFHGLERKYKVQQQYLEERKLNNSLQNLEHTIDLEVQQATINLSNNLESLKIQKRNMDLAQENVRIVQIENEKGIANNIEVVNAETDLKESQNNYYTALYNALISKTDLDKARGTLLKN